MDAQLIVATLVALAVLYLLMRSFAWMVRSLVRSIFGAVGSLLSGSRGGASIQIEEAAEDEEDDAGDENDLDEEEEEYTTEVVGESKFQKALESICGKRTRRGVTKHVDAALLLEDSNPHDSKAVRVEINGKTVGYLRREDARTFRKKYIGKREKRDVYGCKAVVRGGWDDGKGDRGHYGVWLDLPL